MPALSDQYIKTLQLPSDGAWFDSQDEAMTHKGVLIEVTVSESSVLYGVYPTQHEFCVHATEFIRKTPSAATVPQIKALRAVHMEIPRETVKKMRLTEEATWFTNELGALTAFSLREPEAHFARVLLENNNPGFDSSKEETYTVFYGIFDNATRWHILRIVLPNKYTLPVLPPFKSNTLEYDRARCTILRARGALYKPPQLNTMTLAEMEPYLETLPPAISWFKTKEDALDMAAFTVEYRLNDEAGTTLYAVYHGEMQFWHCFEIVRKREWAAKRYTPKFSANVVQDPALYDKNHDDM